VVISMTGHGIDYNIGRDYIRTLLSTYIFGHVWV
jgi:hypothetical protein